jgi:hypothetical protein
MHPEIEASAAQELRQITIGGVGPRRGLIALFPDNAARSIRASYAVAVAVIEVQLPADRCAPLRIRVIDQ